MYMYGSGCTCGARAAPRRGLKDVPRMRVMQTRTREKQCLVISYKYHGPKSIFSFSKDSTGIIM